MNDVDVAWSGSQLTLTNTVNARYQMDTKNKPYWGAGAETKRLNKENPRAEARGFSFAMGKCVLPGLFAQKSGQVTANQTILLVTKRCH